MNPNFSPENIQEETLSRPSKEAANEPKFELTPDETKQLFEKRKAIEWMLKHRTDSESQRIYTKELADIQTKMASFGISESQYRNYLTKVEEAQP
jgi:hypothetical protein